MGGRGLGTPPRTREHRAEGEPMTSGQDPDGEENLGRVDDEAEEREESSTTEGAAAAGEYDPGQGSPGPGHPTGEAYPDEATRFDDPEHRGRAD